MSEIDPILRQFATGEIIRDLTLFLDDGVICSGEIVPRDILFGINDIHSFDLIPSDVQGLNKTLSDPNFSTTIFTCGTPLSSCCSA